MANTKIPVELSSTPGIVDNSNATAITIDSSENVGIGTSSPSAKLSIGGGTAGNYTDGISLQKSGGNVYGIYPSTNNLEFRSVTGGNHIATFDYFGNVGIGFTSPQAKLQVLDQLKVSTSDQSQGVVALGDGSSTQFGVGIARWNGSSNSGGAGGLGYFSQGTVNSGGHFFYTGDAAAGSTTLRMSITADGTMGFGMSPLGTNNGSAFFDGNVSSKDGFMTTASDLQMIAPAAGNTIFVRDNGNESARILSNGVVLIGTTSQSGISNTSTNHGISIGGGGQYVVNINNDTNFIINRSNGTGNHIQFRYNGGNTGSISTNGSTVSYNTSSDARLKDVTGSARGLEVINKLNPVAYNWKESGQADEGLIAQEVLDVVPNAVSGSEEEIYQMDYSKLVVHLVKGMKEQQAQIEALQSEINELKNS